MSKSKIRQIVEESYKTLDRDKDWYEYRNANNRYTKQDMSSLLCY